ncbi:hypothetical protein B0J18DRAFT_160178 [Chaetomium sp. MPI-SDFR-AT-0129]|nr:hypothetical protein B0J18DRAFT_160178 [Chaetomium sp. MPI-SDFR-AT-0129]
MGLISSSFFPGLSTPSSASMPQLGPSRTGCCNLSIDSASGLTFSRIPLESLGETRADPTHLQPSLKRQLNTAISSAVRSSVGAVPFSRISGQQRGVCNSSGGPSLPVLLGYAPRVVPLHPANLGQLGTPCARNPLPSILLEMRGRSTPELASVLLLCVGHRHGTRSMERNDENNFTYLALKDIKLRN